MSAFEQTFRQKGISLTSSRLAIFEVLENASAHMTVTDIFNAARQKDPGLGMATVYRTLNMLCDLGLAEKHEFPNIDAVYEKTGAGNGHHHHIIDADSGRIEEFSAAELDVLLEKIAREHGYEMLGHKIEIYGKKKGRNAASGVAGGKKQTL